MSRWHLIVDVERCEDCNNCLLACKDEHVDNSWPGYAAPQPRHAHRWIDIQRKERGDYPLIDVAYLPVPCMQCDQAPCIEAGQGSVYKRADGIVIIDPERARGLTELPDSCPYGAIYWNAEEDLPQKCTLCAHLLDAGWIQTRCVQACPTGALRLVRLEDGEATALVEREGLEHLHPRTGTAPTVYYRNLARFQGVRVAGTVTLEQNGVVDCAKRARMTLRAADGHGAVGAAATTGAAPGASAAKAPAETLTDAFGDYVFDGVTAGAAGVAYVVAAELAGFPPAEVAVQVEGSRTVEPIHLGPRAAQEG